MQSCVVDTVNKDGPELFTFDLTKTLGKEQSLDDLCSIVEDTKNSFLQSQCMGKRKKAIFDFPYVIIFTNKDPN